MSPKELQNAMRDPSFARPEDWGEDFEHENGNYMNICWHCKTQFRGHKRRVICKKCSTIKEKV